MAAMIFATIRHLVDSVEFKPIDIVIIRQHVMSSRGGAGQPRQAHAQAVLQVPLLPQLPPQPAPYARDDPQQEGREHKGRGEGRQPPGGH
eukprot:CAMPEP_0113944776 /NCGR_PEP_ID=MMETSP1339-20121228/36755_1 /TAXON_ID=94617 /ORGANISM="Fibrocapsa japonica" /LENGTH=89 /DNA_ID=CAMNT_0000950095 /DNA_START=372 /DNA_END=639 /DNA_ORIENTATION=+ /assembly_acc=CAM_ASM_000762